MRRTLLTILAAVAVLVGLAAPAQATGWTTVRSTTTSNAVIQVVMKDGALLRLQPGQSTSYYRAEPRVVQWATSGVCVKVQVANGSWFILPVGRTQWTPPEDKASAVKAWRCTG